MTAPIVRFAPSPTGRLHIGNARSALFNWGLAKGRGRAGTFILRYDDTDTERSQEAYVTAIAEDLAWLGIIPDRVERQTLRTALYEEAAAQLRAAGRLYPCFETAEELERRRKLRLARGLPPVYGREALALTDQDRARLEAEGRKPHWRFRLSDTEITWDDGVRGPTRVGAGSVSDPVVAREDGTFLYTFTSVVDDLALGITDIVRGEDHVTNTAVQIDLFRALGGEPPRFAHHNLLTTADGTGLSKRLGHLSLGALREADFEALAVATLAVLVGTAESVRPLSGLDALADLVDVGAISRSPARFDEAELAALHARILHGLPFDAVAERLSALGVGGGEAFWLAVRDNVARLPEARDWWQVVTGPLETAREDPDLLEAAADLLPPEPWTPNTFGDWTRTLQAKTGRKGRALFHPLRLALTGRDAGPDLKTFLPLIGRERALSRLAAPARASAHDVDSRGGRG